MPLGFRINAVSFGLVGARAFFKLLGLRPQTQLPCHVSAQRRLLTAVCCSSHGIGLSFFCWGAGPAVTFEDSPELYLMNTTTVGYVPDMGAKLLRNFSGAGFHIRTNRELQERPIADLRAHRRTKPQLSG